MLDMPVYFINYLFRAFKFNMTFCIHKDLFSLVKHVNLFSFTCLTNIIHAPLLHTGGGEEGRGRGGRESKKRKSAGLGGGESKKRKSADGLESKALRKRRKTKHRTAARQFAFCRWRGTVGKSKTRRR